MYLVAFTYLDAKGKYLENSFMSDQLDLCFGLLNSLVEHGCTLLTLQLHVGTNVTTLPIEAFDGKESKNQISKLQAEWNEVLGNNNQDNIL